MANNYTGFKTRHLSQGSFVTFKGVTYTAMDSPSGPNQFQATPAGYLWNNVTSDMTFEIMFASMASLGAKIQAGTGGLFNGYYNYSTQYNGQPHAVFIIEAQGQGQQYALGVVTYSDHIFFQNRYEPGNQMTFVDPIVTTVEQDEPITINVAYNLNGFPNENPLIQSFKWILNTLNGQIGQMLNEGTANSITKTFSVVNQYSLQLDIIFQNGETSTDHHVFNVVAPTPPPPDPEPDPDKVCELPPALITGLAFKDLKFVENLISHHVPSVFSVTPEKTRYYADLYIPDEIGSDTYQKVFKFESAGEPAYIEGGLTFYPGAQIYTNKVLAALLSQQRPSFRPEYEQKEISEMAGFILPYYLKTYVFTGSSTTSEVQTDTFYGHPGGLSFEDFPDHNFFTGYMDAKRQFLSWYPGKKTVDETSQDFLYYLVNFLPLPTKLILKANINYLDGDCIQKKLLEISDITLNSVYIIPAGPANLPGLQSENKVVSNYTLWLQDADGHRLSELKTYLMDEKPRRNVKHFLFKNSLGGFDSIRCIGISQHTLTVARESVQKFTSWDYSWETGEVKTISISADGEMAVSTGWISADVLDYLHDFYVSKEIYIIEKGKYLPVQLVSKDLIHHKDDDTLKAHTFKIKRLYNKDKYSRMPAVKFPTVYWSEKEYTATCPEGQTGTPVTKTAIRSSTEDQATADGLALTAAMVEAQAALVCTIDNTPPPAASVTITNVTNTTDQTDPSGVASTWFDLTITINRTTDGPLTINMESFARNDTPFAYTATIPAGQTSKVYAGVQIQKLNANGTRPLSASFTAGHRIKPGTGYTTIEPIEATVTVNP